MKKSGGGRQVEASIVSAITVSRSLIISTNQYKDLIKVFVLANRLNWKTVVQDIVP